MQGKVCWDRYFEYLLFYGYLQFDNKRCLLSKPCVWLLTFETCLNCSGIIFLIHHQSAILDIKSAHRAYQNIVTSCWLSGPRNSWLIRCSRIQTTTPTKRKKAPVTPHISQLNGLRKAQAVDFTFLTGVTTTSPDSMYGWVKSTILVLLVTMVMSPTAASYFWKWSKSLYYHNIASNDS